MACANLVLPATLERVLDEGDSIGNGSLKNADDAVLVNILKSCGELNRTVRRIDAEVALVELEVSLAKAGVKEDSEGVQKIRLAGIVAPDDEGLAVEIDTLIDEVPEPFYP